MNLNCKKLVQKELVFSEKFVSFVECGNNMSDTSQIRDKNLKKFALCLKELGITENTFRNRKRLTPIAYLMQQVFHIDLGLEFGWYLHGVYIK